MPLLAAPIQAKLDALRSVLAPGVKLYALAHAAADSKGYSPITIGTDTTGRVKHFGIRNGWLPGTGTADIPLAISIVESRLLTADLLAEIAAFGLLPRRAETAVVYDVRIVGVPIVKAKPEWRFTCTRTVQTYTPGG